MQAKKSGSCPFAAAVVGLFDGDPSVGVIFSWIGSNDLTDIIRCSNDLTDIFVLLNDSGHLQIAQFDLAVGVGAHQDDVLRLKR